MRYLPLLALLGLSGLFSASETALFSLDEDGRKLAGRRARALLAAPRNLLLSLLVANLFVNSLFFAIQPWLFAFDDARGALLAGFGSLVALLLAGEIVPKTLALSAPVVVSRWVAWPISVVVTLLTPLWRWMGAILDVLMRLTGEAGKRERRVTPDALAAALERSAEAGLLAAGEADLLAEIVELSSLAVREIMTPRVDMLALDLEASEEEREEVLREAKRSRVTWLPVIRGDADNVVGRVDLRDLLADPRKSIESLVMPVAFVPEVAKVLTMLHTLREKRVAEALVVDEWGGTAGVVTLEDLFEQIVGDMRVEGEDVVKPVIPMGEGRFRVSGSLSLREWNDLLGVEVHPTAFETVGGYVTALLGRIPRAGDRVALGQGLMGEVREVRGRRVVTVDLFLENAAEGSPAWTS